MMGSINCGCGGCCWCWAWRGFGPRVLIDTSVASRYVCNERSNGGRQEAWNGSMAITLVYRFTTVWQSSIRLQPRISCSPSRALVRS